MTGEDVSATTEVDHVEVDQALVKDQNPAEGHGIPVVEADHVEVEELVNNKVQTLNLSSEEEAEQSLMPDEGCERGNKSPGHYLEKRPRYEDGASKGGRSKEVCPL